MPALAVLGLCFCHTICVDVLCLCNTSDGSLGLDVAAQRRIHALVRVGRAMSSTADYEQALKTLIETISEMLDVETAGFMLYDAEHDELQLQQPAFGIDDPEVIRAYRVPLREGGNAVQVFLTLEPYISNQATQDSRLISQYVRLFHARNVLTVPLVVEDQAIGVCHAINKREGDFNGDDPDLFALIAPLSMAFAPLGARLAHTIPSEWLSTLFAIFLAITAIRMLMSL